MMTGWDHGEWGSAKWAGQNQAFGFLAELEHPWATVRVDVFPVNPTEPGQPMESPLGASGWGLARLLTDLAPPEYRDADLSIWFEREDGRSSPVHEARLVDVVDREAVLRFEDESTAQIPLLDPADSAGGEPSTPPDHPSRLQEPITVDEYGAIEAIIGALQDLVDSAELDVEERSRAEGAIDVLRTGHRAARVGETRRAEILAIVRAVVELLFEKLPKKLVLWSAAGHAIESWYPSVARLIERMLG